MRYWWVNQNQTYRQEIDGGYMWSPKVSKNGKLNPFYEFMREVAPGDLIFSFADTRVKAVGIALSPCYDCPKPIEFGAAGRVWGDTGWRVDVRWRELREQIKPKDHMEFLSPFLPAKYSPLVTYSISRSLPTVGLSRSYAKRRLASACHHCRRAHPRNCF